MRSKSKHVINSIQFQFMRTSHCMLNTGMTMNAVAMNIVCSTRAIRHLMRIPRGSVVRCLTRNPGSWVRAALDPRGFFEGVSFGKTLQSLA